MKTKLLAVALATVIAPLSKATPIDDLITTSQSIRTTFDYSIKAVGGLAHNAHNGTGIAQAGITDPGMITKAQADAYNASVQNFKAQVYTWNPNSNEYFEQQSQQALNTLGERIDAFVDAAVAVVTITETNIRAQEAADAPDARESIALQEYMDETDVLLDESEREAFNSALQDVEDAAITAAAYTAIANDQSLLDEANDAAYQLNVTYAEATKSYFDGATGQMTIEWNSGEQSSLVALNVSGYFKDSVVIIQDGADSLFYYTSPEGPCWWLPTPEEQQECLNGY